MIYPIDQMIDDLIVSSLDPETGELILSDEELEAKINDLHMSFDEKIDQLASEVKNLKAEAADIRDEKMKLAARQARVEKQMERTKRFLAYLLRGERFKNGRHNISYRKSEELVLDENFIPWAEANAPGLLRIEPEPRKADIKAALKNGLVFDYAHLEEKINIQVK